METEIITAILGSATTVVVAFIPFFAKYQRVKRKAESYVSTGLAVGYYYNFVKPVFEILEVTEMEVGINKKDSNEIESTRKFESDHVDVEIIIPRELSAPAINQLRTLHIVIAKRQFSQEMDKRNFTTTLYR